MSCIALVISSERFRLDLEKGPTLGFECGDTLGRNQAVLGVVGAEAHVGVAELGTGRGRRSGAHEGGIYREAQWCPCSRPCDRRLVPAASSSRCCAPSWPWGSCRASSARASGPGSATPRAALLPRPRVPRPGERGRAAPVGPAGCGRAGACRASGRPAGRGAGRSGRAGRGCRRCPRRGRGRCARGRADDPAQHRRGRHGRRVDGPDRLDAAAGPGWRRTERRTRTPSWSTPCAAPRAPRCSPASPRTSTAC